MMLTYEPSKKLESCADARYRTGNMPIESVKSILVASKWRERERTQKDRDEYNFYVNEYNKNSEVTTSRFICILN